ncbi:hypothetical protein C7S18_02990 [Ahniella affigens]|uniref:Uncharacterized protein n=2 Tax=Ahniella affigens TaxID=2021234 RepID=A0A2P1PN02_9GAMM|nr:hypothetical protein C7S18_02990 [Ahniella affigens]
MELIVAFVILAPAVIFYIRYAFRLRVLRQTADLRKAIVFICEGVIEDRSERDEVRRACGTLVRLSLNDELFGEMLAQSHRNSYSKQELPSANKKENSEGIRMAVQLLALMMISHDFFRGRWARNVISSMTITFSEKRPVRDEAICSPSAREKSADTKEVQALIVNELLAA